MKRVRDGGGARHQLRDEGIVIFGDYAAHQALAGALGLPVPGPGEFVSARLVRRAEPAEPGDPAVAPSVTWTSTIPRTGKMGASTRKRWHMTARWGITLPLPGMDLPGHRAIVETLESLGYTDAWSAETNGIDAFTPLALAAGWTRELRLGTAIAAIYTRGPGLLAMSAATVAGLAPGRFVLGVGTSSPVIVEQWNGIELAQPYQRARDTLRFLRAALAGEKVNEDYETFSVHGFRLDNVPSPAPGLALAALRA